MKGYQYKVTLDYTREYVVVHTHARQNSRIKFTKISHKKREKNKVL